MQFTGHVEEYILRNLGVAKGKIVHVRKNADVLVFNDGKWDAMLKAKDDLAIEIANILPGYDEVYYPHRVHCTKVLWKTKVLDTENQIEREDWLGVDVNDILEVQNA